jgi:predicted transcriptional regulator
MNEYKDNSKDHDINQPVTGKIIDFMEKNKYVSVGDIIRELGLSYQEGMKYVLELQDKGIIKKAHLSAYYTLNDINKKSQ